MNILAGIVLFNPDIERLKENIEAVNGQVDKIILFNNGSKNILDIEELINKYSQIEMISSTINNGIAYALSEIMKYALANAYEWVLSLDQDSVLFPNLVEKYKSYFYLKNVGALTCNIIDRNFNNIFRCDEKIYEVKTCITSAMMINTEAYFKTDGYDIKMFIDGVDFDICLNLRKNGFKIFRINFDGVLHEVGHGKEVNIFGKRYVVYNENKIRHYYMARNSIYLSKKYKEEMSLAHELLSQAVRILLVLMYENDKKRKIASRVKGIIDGFKMKEKSR